MGVILALSCASVLFAAPEFALMIEFALLQAHSAPRWVSFTVGGCFQQALSWGRKGEDYKVTLRLSKNGEIKRLWPDMFGGANQALARINPNISIV